jgi:hypothetical protein
MSSLEATHDPDGLSRLLLQPTGTWHRRTETRLRSYFVEQQPLAEVAQHHG